MSIINSPIVNQTVLTEPQKISRTKAKILARNTRAFQTLKSSFTDNWNDVWTNEDGLTAAQVLASFGPDGGKLVLVSSGVASLINSIEPGAVDATPTKPLTIAEDGNVTVGA